jgi:hypothetical protein
MNPIQSIQGKQETRNCQNCKTDFRIEPDDFTFYEKVSVPPPTICPDCRLERRLAWWNMRSIYKRACDLCKKDKISVYSPDKPYTVYCSTCWWSDDWDQTEIGRDYDFSRSFFEQFDELLRQAPLVGRFGYESQAVRSDWVNMFTNVKDCYLSFHVDNCERCMYSYYIGQCNDCNGLALSFGDELCYHSIALQQCNRVFFSKYSESCIDSWFLKNCVGCTNCFASANLKNKQYHIFNKPYGNKEAYEKKLTELGFDQTSYISVQVFKEKTQTHWQKYPSKYMHGIKNSNATGDIVNNSKNTFSAFNVRDAEDVKYVMNFIAGGGKDSMDWTQYGDKGELMYEVLMSGGETSNCHFSWTAWKQSRDCEYGVLNVNCSNCFGCVGLKNKQYCVLNKQYSKEEYESLREKIIEQMKENREYGEFFPIQMSPFGYNETGAGEEYKLTEAEARGRGYKWTDIEKNKGKYNPTMEASELPDKITDAEDSILKEVISCGACRGVYRIVPAELDFHRNLLLPLPRLCVDCRYFELMSMRNPFKLYARKCQCAGTQSDNELYANTAQNHLSHEMEQHCPNRFETSYSPERKEIVYCKECYEAEVV